MSEDYTPFKMKGNPFTTGGVQGTNSHVSALKKRKEKNIHELVEKRRDLKEKEEKLKDKKFLGNLRRKRNEKKQEKVQKQINENPTAQEWRRKGKKKKSMTKTVEEKSGRPKHKIRKQVEPYEVPTSNISGIVKKAAKLLYDTNPAVTGVKAGKKLLNAIKSKNTIVDHPDGYSRDQESSLIDKVKKGGSDLLDLLKKSNQPITSIFKDENKDGKDDRQSGPNKWKQEEGEVPKENKKKRKNWKGEEGEVPREM